MYSTVESPSQTNRTCFCDSLYYCLILIASASVSSSPRSRSFFCSFLACTPSIIESIRISSGSVYSQPVRMSQRSFTKLSNDSPLFTQFNLCRETRLFFLGLTSFLAYPELAQDLPSRLHRSSKCLVNFSTLKSDPCQRWRTGRGGGGALAPPPPHFLQMVFFLHANARHSKPKAASRCRHAANIAFDLFNIFLYVIACKVRKCLLSPLWQVTLFCRVLCEWQTFWCDLYKRQTTWLLYN